MCICGFCARVWISHMHLWIVCVDLSRGFGVCVCGSLACICGLCAHVWISHMHLWIVCACVDLSRAFVDCVRVCGSLHMHLWIVCACVDLSRAFVDLVHTCVDLSRAFVDCVRVCGSLACICGFGAHVCGSLMCICGLCARVWISHVHLWIWCRDRPIWVFL